MELPKIVAQGTLNKDKLLEYFNFYDIETLNEAVDVFV